MNSPSTAPRELDSFETALLGELREHVATRAPAAAPSAPSRRPGRRWAAGVAAAAAAATAYVVVSPGWPAVSPAYAVDQEADGDVVVTIHRLEDATGLEAALREHGIDATVSFDPSTGEAFTFDSDGFSTGEPPPAEEGKGSEPRLSKRSEVSQAGPGVRGGTPGLPDCGLGAGDPATLTHEGDEWVLFIPAGSPLQDRPVAITTGVGGELGVGYEGNDPNSYCGVFSSAG